MIGRRPKLHPLARVVAEFGRAHPDATFVQVGSNDGLRFDPLREEIDRRRWRGVLVEPLPHVFERLVANRGGNARLVLENVAIADEDGVREFHYLPEQEDAASLPDWYDLLGSFRRDVVLSHADRIPDLERRVVTTEVRCSTFAALCERNGIDRLDLLHIDAEGYDFEIIKLVDLERLRPKVVLYEHYHLDDEARAACRAHLAAHGYQEIANGMDALCLRPDLIAGSHRRLLRTWRRLHRG